MDFFNKLGKKATEAYQATKEKATDLTEELKIKGKISDAKNRINAIYTEIGKIVYEEVKDNKDVAKDAVVAKCDEIKAENEKIERLEDQLLAVKDLKRCVTCHAELPIDTDYCPKCGTKQPENVKVEVTEEAPTDAEEAPVVEVNDVNDDENKDNNNQ